MRELAEEIQTTPVVFFELAILSDPFSTENGVAHHMFVVTEWTGAGPLLTDKEHSEIRWFEIHDAVNLHEPILATWDITAGRP
ncbi:MAG: NUDIX hydrolase [Acidobacteria bacterium]|nr:NUDIX hydrolase [Acidobacteriota bacterium]